MSLGLRVGTVRPGVQTAVPAAHLSHPLRTASAARVRLRMPAPAVPRQMHRQGRWLRPRLHTRMRRAEVPGAVHPTGGEVPDHLRPPAVRERVRPAPPGEVSAAQVLHEMSVI